MYRILEDNLRIIRRSNTKQANKKRSKGLNLKRGEIVYLLRKNIKIKRLSDKLDYIKLGPFIIKNKLGLVTYKLVLPKETKIHLVFYILLLERALLGAKRQGLIEIKENI